MRTKKMQSNSGGSMGGGGGSCKSDSSATDNHHYHHHHAIVSSCGCSFMTAISCSWTHNSSYTSNRFYLCLGVEINRPMTFHRKPLPTSILQVGRNRDCPLVCIHQIEIRPVRGDTNPAATATPAVEELPPPPPPRTKKGKGPPLLGPIMATLTTKPTTKPTTNKHRAL